MLKSNGYLINEANKCVYYKYLNSKCLLYAYMLMMLIFWTSMDMVTKTKNFLPSNFNMKDMGEACNPHN